MDNCSSWSFTGVDVFQQQKNIKLREHPRFMNLSLLIKSISISYILPLENCSKNKSLICWPPSYITRLYDEDAFNVHHPFCVYSFYVDSFYVYTLYVYTPYVYSFYVYSFYVITVMRRKLNCCMFVDHCFIHSSTHSHIYFKTEPNIKLYN